MNIGQRFTLLVKSSITAVFDAIEDPERSLYQLVLDMEDELEAAKRAAARAMANEDRLKAKIAFHDADAREWTSAAERAFQQGNEPEARECFKRAERAERQRDKLRQQLDSQAKDTEEIRQSVAELSDRVGQAKARLQILQAKLRQGEARRAINNVMSGVSEGNLYGEFERLGERVEEMAACERAYGRIDDQITGADLKRRVDEAAVNDAAEKRIDELRRKAAAAQAPEVAG
jgi:phage shock protein A